MAKQTKELTRKNNQLSVKDSTEIAVKIVGAVLNGDSSTLLKLLDKHKNDDEIAFCILSGLLHLLGKEETTLNEIFDVDWHTRAYPELKKMLTLFEKILRKREYHQYAVATLPMSNTNKLVFLEDGLIGTLQKLFQNIFAGEATRYHGDESFTVATIVNTIIEIALGYEVVSDSFSKKFTTMLCGAVDNVYVNSFSSSKATAWNARRAALEYFLKQLVIFNDRLSKEQQSAVLRRWKAWFLLEDQYKSESKRVNRKNLLDEMKVVLKNV